MDELGKILIYIICIFIFILLYLIVSFIENTFFSLRITFSNSNQQKDTTNFLQKYHIKYKIRYNYAQNGRGTIVAEKGLLPIFIHIIKYLKLRRFFSDSNIIENAYFQVLYETNNVKITNKITHKKIVNINNEDEIWNFVIDNISEFFDENQLIGKLEEFGYITDKQVIILKTPKILNTNKNLNCSDNYLRNRRKVLDINNCTIKQLNVLPGITLIIAKKLIQYREDNGGFNSVTDFWNITGVSLHQRIEIEKKVILKAKKVKNSKSANTLINKIEMLCERIVDI